VPVQQFREYISAVRARSDWHVEGGADGAPPAARTDAPVMTVYEGKGRHACLALDDADRFKACVRSWLPRTGVLA
jgi:hypothetical protein